MLRRLAILAITGVYFLLASPAAAATPPPLRGEAVLLMDGLTGQLLYQQNGSERHFPASTTKLLTALVAVERGRLDQKIEVSRGAIDKGPDSATCSISEGDKEPLEYLLYGLLLRSGNDCADAIAEGLSGGRPEQFVAWMNETARQIGATNSHFTNPHGLHDANHYTTPRDLALIARAALANPVIRKVSRTEDFLWPGKERNGVYHNLLNDLLRSTPNLIGGKTGFTEEAGFTLAVMAEQGGRQLVGVTMGYESRGEEFEDMAALLEYGFSEFVQVDAVTAGSSQGEVPVIDGQVTTVPAMVDSSFAVTAPKGGGLPRLSMVSRLQPEVKAPIAVGQQLGVLEIRDGETLLGSVPIVAKEGVAPLPSRWQVTEEWAFRIARWLVGLIVGLMLFRAVVRAIRRRRRRLRRPTYAPRGRAVGVNGAFQSNRFRYPR